MFLERLSFSYMLLTVFIKLTKNKIFQALLGDLNEDHWSEEINNLINSTSSVEQSYSSIEWRLGNAFEIMGQTGEFHLF